MSTNVTLQCDDPQLALEKNALLVRACVDAKEQINKFNNTLTGMSEGKLGVANEQLVGKLVELGSQGLKDMLDAAIEFIVAEPMAAAFLAYTALTGEYHESDPRN